jgi:hypothetical protein
MAMGCCAAVQPRLGSPDLDYDIPTIHEVEADDARHAAGSEQLALWAAAKLSETPIVQLRGLAAHAAVSSLLTRGMARHPRACPVSVATIPVDSTGPQPLEPRAGQHELRA